VPFSYTDKDGDVVAIHRWTPDAAYEVVVNGKVVHQGTIMKYGDDILGSFGPGAADWEGGLEIPEDRRDALRVHLNPKKTTAAQKKAAAAAAKKVAAFVITGLGFCKRYQPQQEYNGTYIRASDEESVNGAPIFVKGKGDGERFVYRSTDGHWIAGDDRSDIATDRAFRISGSVRSASTEDASPVDVGVTRWQVFEYGKWGSSLAVRVTATEGTS